MSHNPAQYPGSIYDGSSPSRVNRDVVRGAEPEDVDQMVAEIIATQQHLNDLIAGVIALAGPNLGFYGATPVTQPTVTGSRGANAALASLLTELATLGLIVDSSS